MTKTVKSKKIALMKKWKKFIFLFILMSIVVVVPLQIIAQPDPPSVPDRHGYNGDKTPQGVPIGSGADVFLAFGILYLAKNLVAVRKKKMVKQGTFPVPPLAS
jgi:hypothetical protein